MQSVDVDCPNDECVQFVCYEYESENGGEGSEHEVTCSCGTRIKFTIEYFASAMNEEEIPWE